MTGINIPIGGDMAPFLAIAAELRGEMKKLSGSVRSSLRPAKGESASVAGAMKKVFQSAFRSIISLARQAASAVGGLFRKLSSLFTLGGGGGLMRSLVGIAGVAGAFMLLKSQLGGGFDLAGEIERTGVALTALTGSAPEAARVMDEMRATWLRTGTDIAEQSGTIRKFIALGFSTDDAMKLQKNILDVAGAVGLTSAEAGLLGSALAQVQAKGIVSMEELRQQIAEKGIPVFDLLAKKLGVTQGELMKLVGDGKVPSEALLSIFLNMEGALGKFSGGAERMGMTFTGLVARMRGAWALLRAEFIAPIADSLKPILDGAIAKLETFKETFRAAGKNVGDAILSTFALIQSGKTSEVFAAGLDLAIAGAIDLLMRGLQSAVSFLAFALPPIFDNLFSRLSSPLFLQGLTTLFEGIGRTLSFHIRSAFPGGPEEMTAADKAFGPGFIGGGMEMMAAGLSSSKKSVGEVMAEALAEGIAAGKEGFGETGDDVKAAAAAYKKLMETVRAETEAMRAKFAPPATGGEEAPFSPTNLGESVKKAVGQAMTLTTSLGRVGGGGFGATFLPMVSEAKKGNQLLARIERNTANMGGLTAAIV
jgi:tape measure domain-containing protein